MIERRRYFARRATTGLLLAAPFIGGCSGYDNFTPVGVAGLEPATQVVAGGNHTCALLKNGNTACWGSNDEGQVGDAAVESMSTSPKWVSLDADATRLSAGPRHTCALFADGTVDCWGDDRSGWLGVASTLPCAAPSVDPSAAAGVPCPVPPGDVPGVQDATTIASGGVMEDDAPSLGFTCVVRGGDTVECWGDNRSGQLGTSSDDKVIREPVQVFDKDGFPLRHMKRLAAGGGHACAVNEDGDVWCWGSNASGQSQASAAGATRVTGASGAVDVAAGDRHSCAALSTGKVMCWGWNLNGQSDGAHTGTEDETVSVSEVKGVTGAKAVAAGARHSCALLEDGGVMCWGSNQVGQLGTENAGFESPPVRAALSARVTAITAGKAHTCALGEGGEVLCWGSDGSGQVGSGR